METKKEMGKTIWNLVSCSHHHSILVRLYNHWNPRKGKLGNNKQRESTGRRNGRERERDKWNRRNGQTTESIPGSRGAVANSANNDESGKHIFFPFSFTSAGKRACYMIAGVDEIPCTRRAAKVNFCFFHPTNGKDLLLSFPFSLSPFLVLELDV